MSTNERPTVRPVTLGRLVEVTHLCDQSARTTEDVAEALDVSTRRARETILEALRINLIAEEAENEETTHSTTTIGDGFLAAVRNEAWQTVSDILRTHSPHYKAFLGVMESQGATDLEEVLSQLEAEEQHTGRTYNATSIDVLGEWAERLGAVQRNAFTGTYYPVTREDPPANFPYALLAVHDELEETAGVNLRQRYLSVPRLRERFCEREGCLRDVFDEALLHLVEQNVGRLELSGAPIDTGAKDALLGIKEISLSTTSDGLVSTTQSTEQVMAGVEQFGKHYYYLAVHDRDLTYTPHDE